MLAKARTDLLPAIFLEEPLHVQNQKGSSFMHLTKRSFFTGCLAAVLLAVSGCQSRPIEHSRVVCIDLSKFYNAQLTNTLNSPAYVKENNLASLPTGRQVFSGVPFQVGGVLQISGKKLKEWGRNEFPEAINGIPVQRRFSQLHVLHGAGGVYDQDGVTIGKLVLHYADKTTEEIEIKNGMHVRDWWGDPKQAITGTSSELAWSGSNPALKQYGGEKPGSLRIYKSTFKNPQPGTLLTSIDFKSTMENSSPFLIAMTVE